MRASIIVPQGGKKKPAILNRHQSPQKKGILDAKGRGGDVEEDRCPRHALSLKKKRDRNARSCKKKRGQGRGNQLLQEKRSLIKEDAEKK